MSYLTLTNPSRGGSSSSSSSPSSYLGQVATRCFQNNNLQLAAAGRWQMARSSHWARDTIVNPTVIYANYALNGVSELAATGGTLKVALEYPAGTFTLANECIAASNGPVAMAAGNNVFTFNVTIPNGKKFWLRPLYQNANGVIYRQFQNNGRGAGPDPDDGWEIGTGTVSDKTTSGTVTSNILSHFPAAILAQTIKPSFLIFGDSRQEGGTDQSNDATYDVGEIPRAVGRTHGYSSMAFSGTLLMNWLAGTNPNVRALASYFSHIVNAYGINDLNGGGRTAAQLAADRAAFAALFPSNKVVGTTLAPLSQSSDGWFTTANQTLNANAQNVVAFNALERAGITGEAFFWDVARALDPYRTGLWPVSRNPNATAVGGTQATFTASIASNGVMTVTAVASGTLKVGDAIESSLTGATPTSPDPSTFIASLGTGTGGTGTYNLSRTGQTIASTTLYTGGVVTNDGLHPSVVGMEMIRDSGVVNLAQAAR
jgi:hypothetical protein